MAFTQVTVSATYLQDGNPCSGTVTFTLSNAMQQSGVGIISPTDRVATLNASGQISIVLDSTEDTATSPTGVTYHVKEQIVDPSGVPARERFYSISLPASGTFDLSTVAPATPDASYQYLLLSGGTLTGLLIAAGGLEDKLGQVYNVKAWGATGNGTTDDTVAIQAALSAAGTAGGGIVLLPPGTYLVSQQLVLQNNVALRGSGTGCTTVTVAPASYGNFANNLAIISTATYCGIFDITIDGQFRNAVSPVATDCGLVELGTNSVLERCLLNDANAYGVYANGSSEIAINDCEWALGAGQGAVWLVGVHYSRLTGLNINNTHGSTGLVMQSCLGIVVDGGFTSGNDSVSLQGSQAVSFENWMFGYGITIESNSALVGSGTVQNPYICVFSQCQIANQPVTVSWYTGANSQNKGSIRFTACDFIKAPSGSYMIAWSGESASNSYQQSIFSNCTYDGSGLGFVQYSAVLPGNKFLGNVAPASAQSDANSVEVLTAATTLICGGTYLVKMTASGTITLPVATGAAQTLTLINVSSQSYTITVAAQGSETINGAASVNFDFGNQKMELFSDGANWWLVESQPTSLPLKSEMGFVELPYNNSWSSDLTAYPSQIFATGNGIAISPGGKWPPAQFIENTGQISTYSGEAKKTYEATGNYQMSETEDNIIIVNASANCTITLPAVYSGDFVVYKIINVSPNTVTVTLAAPSATSPISTGYKINGAASITLGSQYTGVDIVTDGNGNFYTG